MTVGLEHPDPHAHSPSRQVGDEWLLTNGIGGFAMGTSSGVHTRRYHGFLVAPLTPPVQRCVVWHSVADEIRFDDGEVWRFPSHDFDGAPASDRDALVETVREENAIRWSFVTSTNHRVDRTLTVEPGRNRARLRYRIHGLTSPARVIVRPFTPLRDFHALAHDGEVPPEVTVRGTASIAIRRDAVILAMTASDGCGWQTDPSWWHGFVYRTDEARGQDWREDIWSPGAFELELTPDQSEASVDAEVTGPTPIDESAAVTRLAINVHSSAARDFVVRRGHGEGAGWSILAGYPWFADWGRDTMIALPGLLLRDGAVNVAWTVLRTFAERERRGLIPNRFDDHGADPHYNTVDASLWFVHAVWSTARLDRDGAPDDLVATCGRILAAYRDGTDYGIRMDHDGLITAGDETTQLTWMDAKRNDVVFTPRHGKAVEINALWYHALRCMAELDASQAAWSAMADRVRASFQASFWWAARSALHDVLVPRPRPTVRRAPDVEFEADGCFRPNQIFAVSLPHTALTDEQCASVVREVGKHLLTPMGLRTLEPEHPSYRGRFEGDMMSRDAAYHNGTVWPWLIGPYVDAMRRVTSDRVAAEAAVDRVLATLRTWLSRMGTLPEICDGDAPHTPAGCPAQAWSVAEVLRVSTGDG